MSGRMSVDEAVAIVARQIIHNETKDLRDPEPFQGISVDDWRLVDAAVANMTRPPGNLDAARELLARRGAQ